MERSVKSLTLNSFVPSLCIKYSSAGWSAGHPKAKSLSWAPEVLELSSASDLRVKFEDKSPPTGLSTPGQGAHLGHGPWSILQKGSVDGFWDPQPLYRLSTQSPFGSTCLLSCICNFLLLFFYCHVPGGSDGKASAYNVGYSRSPGEGNGNPLQYSCLENPVDGGAW